MSTTGRTYALVAEFDTPAGAIRVTSKIARKTARRKPCLTVSAFIVRSLSRQLGDHKHDTDGWNILLPPAGLRRRSLVGRAPGEIPDVCE